jgi:hypothetical protein
MLISFYSNNLTMKKALFLLLIVPFFFSSFIVVENDDHCLEVKGFLLDQKDKKLDKVTVSLLEDGQEIKNMETKCPFTLELQRDKYYSLVITKEGYSPAVIVIDSKVPKNHSDCNFHFEFHYNMVPADNNYNKEYIDFPAAIVKYAKSGDEFVISDKYNTHIKSMISSK